MFQVAGPLVFAGAVLAALLVGPVWLAVVAVVGASAALVDAVVLLGRAGARPVLPVAAIPGVAMPVLAALDGAADPAGWERISGTFAVTVIVGFALVLVFGRRRGVVSGLGATFAAGLLVGLGATSLLLLRTLADGVVWVLALTLLVVVADVAAAAALALARRRADVGPVTATLLPLVAVALATVALVLVVGPPLEPALTGLLAAAAAVAALGGDHLRRTLAVEAGVGEEPGGIGTGGVLGCVDGLLLAAPIAYVLARAAVL